MSLDGLATYLYAAFLAANPPLHKPINEMECMMEAITFEAVGEPIIGKVAVANVINNRVKSPYFPNSVCGVVHDRYQFSYRNKGKPPTFRINNNIDKKAFQDVVYVSYYAVQGQLGSIVGDADHYYNPSKASPVWGKYADYNKQIGKHLFVTLNY